MLFRVPGEENCEVAVAVEVSVSSYVEAQGFNLPMFSGGGAVVDTSGITRVIIDYITQRLPATSSLCFKPVSSSRERSYL